MKEYYLHNGDKKEGPFNLDDLKNLKINNQTYIWHEGLNNWTLASEIPELVGALSKTPPPFLKEIRHENQKSVEQTIFKIWIKKALNLSKKQYLLISIFLIFIITASYFLVLNYKLSSEIKQVKDDNASVSTEAENAKFQLKNQEDEVRRLNQARKATLDSINQALFNKQKRYRDEWPKFIKQSNLKYDVSFWGGISNLNFTISNLTEYSIDEIEVEVRYILKNGNLFQTEIIKVNDLIPYSQRKLTAPSTNRGTSVIVSFKNIKAQSFNFCYGYDISNGNKNDPWLCK